MSKIYPNPVYVPINSEIEKKITSDLKTDKKVLNSIDELYGKTIKKIWFEKTYKYGGRSEKMNILFTDNSILSLTSRDAHEYYSDMAMDYSDKYEEVQIEEVQE